MPNNDSDDKTRSHVHLAHDTVIGHYRIIQKIGSGGMGEVYLAQDTELNRKVALKFLPPHLCADPECRARFKREAQAAAKLDHPNIVSVFEVGAFQGRPFFSMQHVEGQSLKEVIAGTTLPFDRIVEIGLQVCDGLQAAHDQKITHRDIKPSNILIDSHGRARIVDFGLASVAGLDHLTKTGSTLGTIGYMSPEQVRGEAVDHRTDLFSLGVVLYELITGHSPFKGDTEAATLHAVTDSNPEPLARFRREVPPALQAIIDKALDKKVRTRYQHADDLQADLVRVRESSTATSTASTVWSRKIRWVGWIAVLLLIAATAILLMFKPWSATRTGQADKIMLAVLPFDNLGSPEDEYFADGMTEEITSRLAGIKGLGVISRTSAMQYKQSGKSLKQIGKELGVTHVLEGSVRWAKAAGRSRVRITPQLIRVSDDRHLWADNYEREMMEVFAVQEHIAIQIVDQLGLTLLESNRAALATRPTADSKAYDHYLRGISGVRRLDWSLQALTVAAANLDTAVMIDPGFALAYAARSRAYTLLTFISASPTFKTVARGSFQRALELQPNLSYGHLAAGLYYNLAEDDYDSALRELNQAVSELHNDADLIASIAFVQFRQGEFAEASENYRKAAECDPLNPTVHASRSEFLRFNRMYEEAEQSINRAIVLDSKRADYYFAKLLGYVSQYGQWQRVREVVREALANADTLEFAYLLMSYSGYSNGLSMDSLFKGTGVDLKGMASRIRSEYRSKLAIDMYYCILTSWYGYTGDVKLKSLYADSARTSLETWLQGASDDWQRASMLSVLFWHMGWCEQAMDQGIRAKELLSIAKCHW